MNKEIKRKHSYMGQGENHKRVAMTEEQASLCPYKLSEQEMQIMLAYCGIRQKWEHSPSYLDAYLSVLPKTPHSTATVQSSRMFAKLKSSGAFDWFLENFGVSLRACGDSLKEAMKCEVVDVIVFSDGTWDYKYRADNTVRFFATRAAFRLHGQGGNTPLLTAPEQRDNKTLSDLISELDE